MSDRSLKVCYDRTLANLERAFFAAWSMENLLCSSLNQIQGWTTVQESYSRALEQGPLVGNWRVGRGKWKPREVFSKWPFGLVRGAAQVTNIRRWGFSGNASQQRGAALHQLITELMS